MLKEITTQEGLLEEVKDDKSVPKRSKATRITKLKKGIADKQVCLYSDSCDFHMHTMDHVATEADTVVLSDEEAHSFAGNH